MSLWMERSHHYLSEDGTLSSNRAVAQKLQHMATRYILIGDLLYKKSYFKLHSDPYLRWLGPDEARREIQEIHDDDCQNMMRVGPLPRRSSTKGTIGPRCSMMPKSI